MGNHAQQERLREIQDAIHDNEQDKGGIEVNWKDGVDFAVVQADTIVEVEVQFVNKTMTAKSLQICRVGGKGTREQDKL